MHAFFQDVFDPCLWVTFRTILGVLIGGFWKRVSMSNCIQSWSQNGVLSAFGFGNEDRLAYCRGGGADVIWFSQQQRILEDLHELQTLRIVWRILLIPLCLPTKHVARAQIFFHI